MTAFIEFALASTPDLIDRVSRRRERESSGSLLRAVKATAKIAAVAAILL